jgi:hypothetical protein
MTTNNITHNQESQINDLSIKDGSYTLSNLQISIGFGISIRKTPMRQIEFDLLVSIIKSDTETQFKVNQIRNEKNKDRRNTLKKQNLHYISFGTFKDSYLDKKSFIKTRVLQFDTDGLDERLNDTRSNLCADNSVFMLFNSPSGNGLKFFVQLDSEIISVKRYEQLHRHYSQVFKDKYGITIDPKTHHAACACFISHDDAIHVNYEAISVSANIEVSEEIKTQCKTSRDELLSFVNDTQEGFRNSNVVSIASALFARDIDLDFAIGLLKKWNQGNASPLPEDELLKTIKHVYADYRSTIDYTQEFTLIHEGLKKQNVGDVVIGQEFFKWLKVNKGAQFYVDERGAHYTYLNRKLIPLERDNNEFQIMLLSMANISTEKVNGRVVCQVLNALAHESGVRINRDTWLHTDLENLIIHLNLKNDKNELLKISPTDLSVVQNGSNDDHVFMLNSADDKLNPINYINHDEVKLREVFEFVEKKIVNHIPTSVENKWIAYAWRMTYPLFDFTKAHLILRFQGYKSSGKSIATLLLSYSLYGKDYLDNATVASMYSDASINPLVLDDNLESKNFYADPGRTDFYLGVATGGGRQKRDRNSDSGLVTEKSRALVICNGIESIAKSEHTSRMMIIPCDRVKHKSDYTSAVLLDIKRRRNEILSAEYAVIHKVLKRIDAGDWDKTQKRLTEDYPSHPKDRMIEHIAIIILVLEELWKCMGKSEDPWNLIKKWMDQQKETSEQEIIGTDPIIQALDIIRMSAFKQDEIETHTIPSNTTEMIAQQKEITLNTKSLLAQVSVKETDFKCVGKAGELLSAFATAYQSHLKKTFPIDRSKVLTQRLSNIRDEISAAGYSLTEEYDNHHKQIKYTFNYKMAA